MLTIAELMSIIGEGESDHLEFTISSREDKIGPAVCAFSNDFPDRRQPGYLILGLDDHGSPTGMSIDDAILQSIGNIRSNGNILPQPAMVVSKVYHLEGGDVVYIEVHPSILPPVRYQGKCWIRIGPRKAVANETEERRLIEKRASSARSFDMQACRDSALTDLDINLFKNIYQANAIDQETLAANNRPIEQQLASLRLFDSVFNCPTNAGILLLGTNPLFYNMGAYVQFLRYDGTDISLAPVEKKFSGALASILKELDNFIKFNILKEKSVRGDGIQESVVYNYPLWAIRELLMNAIMHRDYGSNAPIYVYEFDDRIEIVNPGGLYGDVNAENFPNTSDYRNPVLSEAMKVLGYVNKYNFGIKYAQQLLQNNGNGVAVFDISLITKFSVKIPVSAKWQDQ